MEFPPGRYSVTCKVPPVIPRKWMEWGPAFPPGKATVPKRGKHVFSTFLKHIDFRSKLPFFVSVGPPSRAAGPERD